MSEFPPCIIAHELEPYFDYTIGDIELLPMGMDWMTPAFYRRSIRLKLRTILNSIKRRDSGLNDPNHGHMNKHLLKMKYIRMGVV